MRVKRYVVESMPDALQRIRNDLGKNAVILNTKEVRSGGLFGMFSKRRIEVIAATDAAPTETGSTLSAPVKSVFNHSPSGAVSTLPNPLAPPKTDALLEEIRQMKEMVSKLAVTSKEPSAYPAELAMLQHKLEDHEVSTEVIEQILQGALQEGMTEPSKSWTEQKADRLVRAQLRKMLTCDEHRTISPDTRIAHFVGPTGVGKTTTIAKLAAEQVLKYNRKVGFITSDTYRIAAIEQLKTYSTILNVPLEVVFAPQELPKAFTKLQDRDIIFMDTAGRNFRNQMYVSELNSLLQGRGSSETFLVLSLTAKYKDMKEITENFARFKLDKVLFTKLDETRSVGAIVNLLQDFPIRLSYITNGQNVPEDISEVSAEQIINLLMGESVHE
jgi:flagellar biosynthesis protein FlhF